MLRQYQLPTAGATASWDNGQDQEVATADPAAFAAEGERPRVTDEVHRGDWLIRAIKVVVDTDPGPVLPLRIEPLLDRAYGV